MRHAHRLIVRGWLCITGGARPPHIMPAGDDGGRTHVDSFDCWCEPVPHKGMLDAGGRTAWVHTAVDGRRAYGG